MHLIVGLGNPGPEYAETRHNVGWRVAERLAERVGAQRWRERFEALLIQTRLAGRPVVLARPLTYMNESGRAVRRLVEFWKVEADRLLVVVDDLALDLGRLRLRPGGSAGGHKGLASVAEHLGHEAYPRLRVGIGPLPEGWDGADFVLGRFTETERPVVERAVQRAADAAEVWLAEGIEAAMNRFNGSSGADGSRE